MGVSESSAELLVWLAAGEGNLPAQEWGLALVWLSYRSSPEVAFSEPGLGSRQDVGRKSVLCRAFRPEMGEILVRSVRCLAAAVGFRDRNFWDASAGKVSEVSTSGSGSLVAAGTLEILHRVGENPGRCARAREPA